MGSGIRLWTRPQASAHRWEGVTACRPADIDEEFGGLGSHGTAAQPPPPIPMDARLQLTLAAINTLFRLLHSIQDLARLVWTVGGKALVNRIVLLASLLKDSFEEAATKILVVFFSHKHIQDAVRDAGASAPQPPTAVLWVQSEYPHDASLAGMPESSWRRCCCAVLLLLCSARARRALSHSISCVTWGGGVMGVTGACAMPNCDVCCGCRTSA